jgi:hypothetical protein
MGSGVQRGVLVTVILDKISPSQKGEGADPVHDAGNPHGPYGKADLRPACFALRRQLRYSGASDEQPAR